MLQVPLVDDPFGDDWPGTPAQSPRERGLAIWSDSGPFDPATIPPRPWLVPGLALRRAVTLFTGAGASGKTSVAAALAVAGAIAEPFGRFRPVAPFQTLLFCAEEDRDEQRRRLAAAAIAQGVPIPTAADAIARAGPTETALLFEVMAERGSLHETRAFTALCDLIDQHRPDLIVLDPLAELHSADENANTLLRAVVARLRTLAQATNCALILVHHSRKGGGAGDQDTARGASSIASAARLHITCTKMTREEAAAFSLPEAHARNFVRLDTGKSNYTEPWQADWFELRPIDIGNGDIVAATVPWTPPAATADAAMQERAAETLRAGLGGEPCSRSPNSAAFYGHAFTAAGLPRPVHGALLAALIAAGTARERAWRDPHARKTFRRLWIEGNAFDGWIGPEA